jgi:hypothetical protein
MRLNVGEFLRSRVQIQQAVVQQEEEVTEKKPLLGLAIELSILSIGALRHINIVFPFGMALLFRFMARH